MPRRAAVRHALAAVLFGSLGHAHAETGGVSGVTADALAALPWPLVVGAAVTDTLTFAKIVQQDFQGCGQESWPDPRLNDLAVQMLRGFNLDRAAFTSVGLPVKAAGMVVVPKLSSWEKVRDSLANQCGNRVGYSRYGVAVQDGRAALVYARPAELDAALVYARPAELDLGNRPAWNAELLRGLNEARRQGQRCGDRLYPPAPPLAWDDTLSRAATQQVTELPQYDFRGHINPVTGSTPPDRARAAGWPDLEVGETLAYDALTPAEAVRGLLDSPPHCKIIMDSRWTRVGTDASNGTGRSVFATYWAQVYGR